MLNGKGLKDTAVPGFKSRPHGIALQHPVRNNKIGNNGMNDKENKHPYQNDPQTAQMVLLIRP
jgi:hypothetical protein